jgi:hypothetical protein
MAAPAPNPVIATVTIPQNGKDEKYEIIREQGANADRQDCYVQNIVTKVHPPYQKASINGQQALYYCEREPHSTLNDGKLVFHRGDKSGPIMATAVPCPFQTSQTDIHFVSPDRIVPLKHKHHAQYRQRDHRFQFQGVRARGNIGTYYRPNVFAANGQNSQTDKAGEIDVRDLVLVTAMTSQMLEAEMKEQGEVAHQHRVEFGISV